MADDESDESHAEIVPGSGDLGAVYAARFEGDPGGELQAWLHIAARREAAISKIHRDLLRRSDLANPTSAATEMTGEVVSLIAHHEDGHRDFIESVLAGAPFCGRTFAADLMIWLATTESTLLDPLTSRLGAEPDLGHLLSLCSVLERAAREPYVHLATLACALRESGSGRQEPDGLSRELNLNVVEEEVHEQAFREMAIWASPAEGAPELSRRDCAHRLARLLPRSTIAGDADRARVLTEAGLGELFEREDLTLSSD
jgi:hypothetical protein